MTPLLELEDVRARYGLVQALSGVSLRVAEGEVVAVLGGNGAGKTTTLRAISGLVSTSGDVRFAGERITRSAPERVARAGIAHVPEGRGIFAELSVHENLRLGAYLNRRGFSESYDRVCGHFPWLVRRRSQQAWTLSGGEQQMLAIARALMSRPRLLLLDEPSLGLAPIVVREIFSILGEVNEKEGLAVLVVEQNAKLALRSSSRAYVLEVGRVALEGPSSELAQDESVRKAYLGY
jgi:branched-chain amino acid transport system ATP-binding protein